MATRHLTQADLDALFYGTLEPERRRALARHLVTGCDRCAALARAAAPAAPPSPAAADRLYDFPLRRAQRFARAYAQELAAAREQARAEVVGARPVANGDVAPLVLRERAAAWLDQARGFRHRDARATLECAALAWATAARLRPEDFADGVVADLQADAWAEIANAHRIAGNHDHAERAFAEAARRGRYGAPAARRAAGHADLVANLLLDARDFPAADHLYGRLIALYRRLGDDGAAGRTLILRAQVHGKLQDFATATRHLLAALDLLDVSREPKLVLYAFHALIDYRAQAGRYGAARRLHAQAEPLYELFGDVMDRIKGRWVEGKIALGLGRFADAAAILDEVATAFAHRNLAIEVALVDLDLARLWLLTGQLQELRTRLVPALETLRALNIRPEALAAVLLLREAIDQERATLALVRRAAEALEGRG